MCLVILLVKDKSKKIQKISSSKDFVSISANMFHDNQDSVQNFKNLRTVEKDNLYTWLALGKSFEESLDPRNSIAIIIGLLVFVFTFITSGIITNFATGSFKYNFLIIALILVIVAFVAVCILVGNLIRNRMRVVQLNNLIEAAINFKE